MGLLQKLLSTLGLRESGTGRGRERAGETTVTVEHEPDTASESAVKGTDGAATGTAASGSTETVADTADQDAGAAEPAEAAGSPADETGDAGEPIEEAEPDEATADAATDGEDATADTDETGTDDAAEAATGNQEPPDVLTGIGPAYAERLADAGVETVADLAGADAAELAEETGLGEGRISNWIEQAEEY